jgi:hypothetical protein
MEGLELILATIWAQDPLAIVLFLLILLAALAGLWILLMMRLWLIVLIVVGACFLSGVI